MTQGTEDGRKQFVSKTPLTVEREIMTLGKNGRWGTKTVSEQVEFAWCPSRKAVIVNPFFKQATEPKNKAKGKK